MTTLVLAKDRKDAYDYSRQTGERIIFAVNRAMVEAAYVDKVVELPGYRQRRDVHAIEAGIRHLLRRTRGLKRIPLESFLAEQFNLFDPPERLDVQTTESENGPLNDEDEEPGAELASESLVHTVPKIDVPPGPDDTPQTQIDVGKQIRVDDEWQRLLENFDGGS